MCDGTESLNSVIATFSQLGDPHEETNDVDFDKVCDANDTVGTIPKFLSKETPKILRITT